METSAGLLTNYRKALFVFFSEGLRVWPGGSGVCVCPGGLGGIFVFFGVSDGTGVGDATSPSVGSGSGLDGVLVGGALVGGDGPPDSDVEKDGGVAVAGAGGVADAPVGVGVAVAGGVADAPVGVGLAIAGGSVPGGVTLTIDSLPASSRFSETVSTTEGASPNLTVVALPACRAMVTPCATTATVPSLTHTFVALAASTSTVNSVPCTMTVAEGVCTSYREAADDVSCTML